MARTRRLLTRFILEFGTAAVAVATRRFEGDLKRGLIFFSIQHANVEHLSEDRDLAWRYSRELVPDDLRRPISVHALSQTLNIPFETARRHVRALEGSGGLVRVGSRGMIVPSQRLATLEMSNDRQAVLTAFSQLVAGLQSIGFPLPKPAPNEADRQRGGPPVFLVTRLINAYILRVVAESIAVYGDTLTGLLFGAIMAANTHDLAHDPVLSWRFAHGDDVPPDEARAPVSVQQLARTCHLPGSTVHRRVAVMLKNGLCERRPGGVIIPTSVAVRPEIEASGVRASQWLLSTFRALAVLGYDFSPIVA